MMFKRVLSAFCAVVICFSLCGCSYFEGYEPFAGLESSGVTTSVEDGNSTTATLKTSTTAQKTKNVTTTTQKKTASSAKTTVSPDEHVAVKPLSGYQYSRLGAAGKQVYEKLWAAVERMESAVDVRECGLKTNEAQKVFHCFLADNPQYFYLSRNFRYRYFGDVITKFYLYYTDGKVTDEFDENLVRLTVKANRNTIKSKKAKLEKKTAKIIAKIPVNATDREKERLIHDYIVENVAYDRTITADNVSAEETLPHVFDVYGAVCKGDAVCEGYSKMFLYLCNRVGVVATLVRGSAGESHMWNAVKLGGDWYHVDVTWDDTAVRGNKYYGYYNITTKKIKKTHKIRYDVLFVPECV